MKTRQDVISRALRRIRVLAMDEAATAEQEDVAGEALTSLGVELELTHGIIMPDLDNVPEDTFLPLAYVLAAEIAPDFARPAPEAKGTAITRLRSVTNPDDREMTDAEFY